MSQIKRDCNGFASIRAMIGLHKNLRAFLANFPALEGFYFNLSRVPPVSVILPFVLFDCYIMLTLVLMLRT